MLLLFDVSYPIDGQDTVGAVLPCPSTDKPELAVLTEL